MMTRIEEDKIERPNSEPDIVSVRLEQEKVADKRHRYLVQVLHLSGIL